jgi:hypothetical protein
VVQKPRARRYPFAASIELVEMESEREIREQTTNLSVFGCQVAVQKKPFSAGTRVRLRIIHRGALFAALGHIVNVGKNSMGVVFTKIEDKDQATLEKWLAEIRDQNERASGTRQLSK